MELLLELRYRANRSTSRVDVRVGIDRDDTIAALTEALSAHAAERGWSPPATGGALVRVGDEKALRPSDTVVDAGLLSGDAVALADTASAAGLDERVVRGGALAPHRVADAVLARDLRMSGRLTLDVIAGPDAGRLIPLRRDVLIGRAGASTTMLDDPLLGREHFAVRVRPDGQVLVDPRRVAAGKMKVAGSLVDEPTVLEPGQVVEAGASSFMLRSSMSDETRRPDRLGLVPLNRVPYRRVIVTPRDLDDLAPPPDLPTPVKLSFVAMLLPAATGVGMAMMFKNYFFLAISAASPLMLAGQWVSNKVGGARRYRREREAFEDRLEEAVARVQEALAAERQERLRASPDLAELSRQAILHMPRLWERDRVAGDLLELRLGLGRLDSHVSQAIGYGGEEALRAVGDELLAFQRTIGPVPVTLDLLDVGAAALWGDRDHVGAAGCALLARAACLHSPEDLVIAAAVGDDDLDRFEWLKWLPHVRSATTPLEGSHLAVGSEGTGRLLAKLLAVAADRAERARGPGAAGQLWPRIVLVVDEAAEAERALLSQLLDVAPAVGMHVLWLGENELEVPRQCRALVACPGKERMATLSFTDPTRADVEVDLDGARPETARMIARALAPLRDASAASQTTALPRVVPLFDVLELEKPSVDAVAARWQDDRPYGLTFPIGMSTDGVYALDLVEQGPHMLIGGTSGSGKSELLQTLVLSLAANHPPSRLNFLFVDYKGGASTATFQDLPHTVGYVTNLSGRLSLRALTSLRAELQRRMAVLEGKAKDLPALLAVDPDAAPPSLVIVVDEFATLVKEVPDFVAGMVDIAQRGRSLGVHLILATQRPTGVVNENILANTNLRVSLRVLDPSDSSNILGSRDAADIPVPLKGRALSRTGPQALVPFQCAWSGAPMAAADEARAVEVEPFTFQPDDGGAAGPLDAPEPAGSPDEATDEPSTQQQVLVDVCADTALTLGLPPAVRPWLEPLPEVLALDRVLDALDDDQVVALTRDPGRVAVLGLYDDPEHQAQRPAAVDLEEAGGLVVFGTGGTGKSTLLRTVAVGLVRQGSPDEVQICALDFASRSLEQLTDLPHCRVVVAGDQIEATCRLFAVLEAEIAARRDVLAAARADSLGALRHQTGAPTFPRIVLLVDGYSGFHGTFDRPDRFDWLNRFQRIVSTGRQVGIHCVLANDRRIGVPPVLLSVIGARLALRMANADDLAALGVPLKVAKDADLPNGRGFLDAATEVQVACVSDDPTALAQSEAVAATARRLAASGPATRRAPGLPELPAALALADLEPSRPADRDPGEEGTEGLCAPFGLVDLSFDAARVDLRRQNLVVMGPPLSGRSTALATVAAGLRATSAPTGVQLCALTSPSSPLARLDVWDDVAAGRYDHAGVVQRLEDLCAEEEAARSHRAVQVRAVLFVDVVEDVDDGEALQRLEAVSRHDAIRLAVVVEPSTVVGAFGGWVTTLRRNRSVLMLQPDSRLEVENVAGVRPELRPDQPFPPGRGIYVANRRWQLVQVAQAARRPGGLSSGRPAPSSRTATTSNGGTTS